MFASTEINYPSDIEWVSTDYVATADYLSKTFGWDVKNDPVNHMAFGDVGLKVNLMIRGEMPYDSGIAQQAFFYMTVPDVKMEINRLETLGASVFKEPEIVPNMGYWSLIKIPGNMIIGLWSYLPGAPHPVRKMTKKKTDEGAMTFFEMVALDARGVVDFFQKAYSWPFEESEFHDAPYWYVSDKESFSLGVREARMGERNGLISFINVNNLGLSTSRLTESGSRVVGNVVDYEPHGFSQKLMIPGGVLLGLWGPSKAGTTQASKPVAVSKPMTDPEKVPFLEETRELAGH
jgi:predicted enzyme related to lactoylglutathione lyase